MSDGPIGARPGVLVPIAAAALVALAALAVVTLLLRPPVPPSRADQAQSLAAELRCPDCQSLSVADSPAQSAAQIRRQIARLLASGRSPEEVREHFVARYGEWVLLAPSRPFVWIVPLLALVGGAALLVAWLAPSRRRGSNEQPPGGVSADEELRRVHDDAEALDA